MNASEPSKPKVVIIGGVAGGASAAAKARRANEHATILLFEKGPYVSFANCGLPYHLSGEIEHRDELLVSTPEILRSRFNIDVRIHCEVTAIDRKRKTVAIRDHFASEEYEESYDKLVISTGAEAIIPPITGVDAKGVFVLKTIPDLDEVLAWIDNAKPESAVVVGGGFIGLEAAEALHTREMEVSVVEASPQLLPPWDPDMASAVERHMQDSLFMEVYTGAAVKKILAQDGVATGVELQDGEALEASLVILAVGAKPLTGLAKDAGLDLGARGLVVTDDHMRTSDPHIYAVGDAVETTHRITGRPTWLPLAGPANRQGRVAGANAAGGDMVFPGVIGTSIVRMGRVVAARTGLGTREALEAGLDVFTSSTTGASHANYYPGAKDLDIKLIVENQTGRLLGAQIVGGDGVDKRIDVLATAIIAKMTVSEIVDLELAYAPPFGSAKDPVNMAAMVAQNLLDGVSSGTTWEELLGEDPPPKILDVRSEGERKTLYAQGTSFIPIDELRDRLGELVADEPLRVYCRIGQRGYYAEQLLRARGFTDVKNIKGGWRSMWGETREDKLIGQEPEN